MAFQEILYDLEDGIATITLNRPDKLNAWTRGMEVEVRQAMTDAGKDPQARVIILTGAGRGFCAGADMNLLNDLTTGEENLGDNMDHYPADGPVDGGLALSEDFHQRVSYFPTVPKPVIAAINGPCAGLGLVMSLYADIRMAGTSAKFTTAFSRRGLIAEHGVSWMLPRLVGLSNALDLLYSARVVEAEEAQHMGLVSRISPDDKLMEDVRDYALEIVRMVSPRSTGIMKRQVYAAQFQNLAEAVTDANQEMLKSMDCEDFKEGVAHFLEKRAPDFTGC